MVFVVFLSLVGVFCLFYFGWFWFRILFCFVGVFVWFFLFGWFSVGFGGFFLSISTQSFNPLFWLPKG